MTKEYFSFSADDLSKLIELSDRNAIDSYGGVEGIAEGLHTDVKNGINPSTISKRTIQYGTNTLPSREIRSFFDMVLEALSDQTILILIICAFSSLILEYIFAPAEERATAWIDGTAILVAVAVVSIVQGYNNHEQEKQFAIVNRIQSVFDVTIIRNGKISLMKNEDVLVGDIVSITQGDRIPADGIIVSYESLKIDESSINGESESVKKDNERPFLYGSTHVTEGNGTFMVTSIGLHSQLGKIYESLNNDRDPTPLQEKLEDLAAKIGYMGLCVAALTFVVLTIPWIFKTAKEGWSFASFRIPLSYFIVALTIIACAVPEGLPLAVTISLAYSMRQMMTDNNFVRQLSACETMGSATVICTDKTGTLTQNLMTVERVMVGTSVYDLIGSDFQNRSENYLNLLKRAVAFNTQAIISDNTPIGSQTECALLKFCSYLHGNYEQIRSTQPVSKRFLFDQHRKMMSTVVSLDNQYRVFVKGAPDHVLTKCSSYFDNDCNIKEIDNLFMSSINENIEKECERAYRTLAIAFKDVQTIPEGIDDAESDLTLICVVMIRDSLRPSAVSSISQCQKAGIKVIMITGDHLKTAEAIAKECGILSQGKRSITGEELRHLSSSEIEYILPNIAVIARSSPMDKSLVVTTLKRMNEVVGVTGDGTNDVPALMAADVGLAMGISGTELAKEASDIVILDDDFKSIVNAVVWGRSIFQNIRRFLQFQLTANVVTLIVSFISSVILRDTPFKAVQLLWVNLIMDSLGALALSTGKPNISLLQNHPEKKSASLISPFMILNIAGQAILQIVIIGGALIYHGEYDLYSIHHYTIVFNVFVLSQMFNLINSRVVDQNGKILEGLFSNSLFLIILCGIGIVQFIIVQFLGKYFTCYPLSSKEWAACLLIAFLSIPNGYLLRKIDPSIFECNHNGNRGFERI